MGNDVSIEDREKIRAAKINLEGPTFADKVSSLLEKPISSGMKMLPEPIQGGIIKSIHFSLEKCVTATSWTMNSSAVNKEASNKIHKFAAGITGLVGGAGGFATMVPEMGFSTIIIFRSISDIARSNGEKVNDVDCRAAILEVFSLGGPSESDDAADSAYFTSRMSLHKIANGFVSPSAKYASEFASISVTRATAEAAEQAAKKGVPVIMQRLIAAATERFGAVAVQKAAAVAVPLIGAGIGASVNLMFMNHFQQRAMGHFTIRGLERKYEPDLIKEIYLKMQVEEI